MKCPTCDKIINSFTHKGRPYCDNCNSLFPNLKDKYGNKKSQRYGMTDTEYFIIFIIALVGMFGLWKIAELIFK